MHVFERKPVCGIEHAWSTFQNPNLLISLETENRSVDDNCSNNSANTNANVDSHFSSLIAEICSGDLFVRKVAIRKRHFPASISDRGKEIIMSETLPKLHSVAAAADHLGVSLKTMWRLINSRQISFIKINRRVLISTDAMNEFLQANTITKLDPDDIARNFVNRTGGGTPYGKIS